MSWFDPDDGDHLKEECGVVGVTGPAHAAHHAYLALYALQHRGQEATGIVSSDGRRFHQHKAQGLVAETFSPGIIEGLKGSAAIGHNRYSTSGGSTSDNVQPIRVTYHGGEIALAHNGQLVNGSTLRRAMETKGSIFQTTSDSEVILHRIAASRAGSLDARLMDALGEVTGAFSLTILAGHCIYVARDPSGFRPLVLGKMDDGWIAASETCALDIVEAEFVREVEPGEVVALETFGPRTVGRLPAADQHRCVFELIYFSRPDSIVFGDSVDAARRRFGQRLAEEHPVEADCVIAVPDSANSAALGYAEASGIPFELGLIRNHYIGRTFIRPGQNSRESGVRLKYNIVRPMLAGKRVIMVDDSIVRGTTSRKLVKLLRRGGVKEIHFRVASPPVRGSCHYGIDTPSEDELIAANHSLEEIRNYLGVDSLGYLSEEGLRGSVSAPDHHCYACFNRQYPFQPPVETDKAGKDDAALPSRS